MRKKHPLKMWLCSFKKNWNLQIWCIFDDLELKMIKIEDFWKEKESKRKNGKKNLKLSHKKNKKFKWKKVQFFFVQKFWVIKNRVLRMKIPLFFIFWKHFRSWKIGFLEKKIYFFKIFWKKKYEKRWKQKNRFFRKTHFRSWKVGFWGKKIPFFFLDQN